MLRQAGLPPLGRFARLDFLRGRFGCGCLRKDRLEVALPGGDLPLQVIDLSFADPQLAFDLVLAQRHAVELGLHEHEAAGEPLDARIPLLHGLFQSGFLSSESVRLFAE